MSNVPNAMLGWWFLFKAAHQAPNAASLMRHALRANAAYDKKLFSKGVYLANVTTATA